jgi:D-beta-D-heptose 7-phosphate kinase/D-beta-D-heptose 1-phosphate adenosyltransferase
MTPPLVVVGDALLDRDLDGRAERLAPDAPVPVVDDPAEHARPGGAALAATLAALLDGREVVLVTALAGDEGGSVLRELLGSAGVTVADLGLAGATAEKIRVRASGQSLLRLDRGGRPGVVGPLGERGRRAIAGAAAVLVADYGRGLAAEPGVRAALGALGARVPLVWDPHPRGPAPVAGARLATPNRAEAAGFAPEAPGAGLAEAIAQARLLAGRWSAAAVAVTRGPGGALLVEGDGVPLVVPAPVVAGGDPCGAGDRFAASVAGAIADGAVLSEAVVAGVHAATAFVAAGGAGGVDAASDGDHGGWSATPSRRAEDAVAAVRARGGTVVATGGCFDLLHAGHVRLLADARALGDCLIVYLNSDASVRRLKGAGRPVVAAGDRRAVLLGLAAVDAVVVFDEDTPERALADLRPDLWVKGADYAVADLPEADLLARWGGRAVVLPYLDGRSTSAMIRKAERHVRHFAEL